MEYYNLEPLLNNDVSVTYDNTIWELHNNADFVEISYKISKREIALIWSYPSEWFRSESPFATDNEFLKTNDISNVDKKIALIFQNVSLLEIKPENIEMPDSEDLCLASINTFYIDDSNTVVDDGSIVFNFQGGLKIRIIADSISFEKEFKTF